MNKSLLCLAAMALLFAASCKKSDSGGGTSGNSWTVGSNTYTVSGAILSSAGGITQIGASTNIPTTNSLQIVFGGSAAIPAAGSYTVVSTLPNNNELSVSTLDPSLKAYRTTGNDQTKATVSFNNGKVTVVMPKAWATSNTSTDSLQISMNITQTN